MLITSKDPERPGIQRFLTGCTTETAVSTEIVDLNRPPHSAMPGGIHRRNLNV